MKDDPRLEIIARMIESQLPEGTGFLVITAPFEGTGGPQEGRMNYVSNISRETSIKLLKEFLFNIGEAESWMKHIE